MRAAVIGLGAEGLKVAVRLAQRGIQVLGIDSDPDKVLLLNSGFSYVREIRFIVLSQLAADEAEATLAPEFRAILSQRSVDVLLIARSGAGSGVESRGSRVESTNKKAAMRRLCG